ncbi:MAG: energy-coupling factor transporter ATPase [Eubacterium aggregans]|uniref:Energy-coupling factor transport system ATP-binding protein n=1 Tax=Eubacterium aggregans TaxID=81409 RepID=A0A1H4DR10_9FIRM|nr:energy-coupling factor transporter ATPase [Eubacterium aggregans]MDD4692033.1 energy-coupling factor transporter ATPase [Eubacterium aggregans]MEA5074694.1 energy-coupling factor transporter ATPase [Eubacterium aggregans]SEA75195.1 energy-coupling factor transport system ATP-binding protein [Eubacterium aggregans]
MENLIEVRDLGYEYPKNEENKEEDTTALRGVDFTVAPGEFVGIIGHNGSGKSTLSKLLNAIILPTKGQVLIKGMDTKDPENLWSIRQTAGMVFQNPDNQLVATIVEEDVAFGPENLGVEPAEIRRRVDECLATVSMGEYRRQKPHQLSGGQKQRIAIAGILAMEPECIIFDEPTAMLDPSGRREVMETIKKLNRDKGMTVLHITHYMTELIDADRIIVLDGGQIVMEGTPREIFRQVTALKAIGLDVPQMTELAFLLRESGFDIPDDLLHIEEMAGALCP